MRTITLIGADGSAHVVACPTGPIQLATNPGVWGLTPHAHTSTRVADIPGERVDDIHPLPRLLSVPILVIGTDTDDLDTQLGALGAILSPDLPVQILFERGDGTKREITAYCVDGADQLVVADHEELFARAPLVFKAFDPWWRAIDADAVEHTETFDDGLLAGSNPVDLTNPSDVAKVWPEITIWGPVENIHMGNLEVGISFRIREVLDVGDVVRIVTDPARRDVWLNDTRAWSVLDPEYSLMWPLIPGLNRLVIRGNGPPSGGSIGSFRFRYAPRFQTC